MVVLVIDVDVELLRMPPIVIVVVVVIVVPRVVRVTCLHTKWEDARRTDVTERLREGRDWVVEGGRKVVEGGGKVMERGAARLRRGPEKTIYVPALSRRAPLSWLAGWLAGWLARVAALTGNHTQALEYLPS